MDTLKLAEYNLYCMYIYVHNIMYVGVEDILRKRTFRKSAIIYRYNSITGFPIVKSNIPNQIIAFTIFFFRTASINRRIDFVNT